MKEIFIYNGSDKLYVRVLVQEDLIFIQSFNVSTNNLINRDIYLNI